jgi:hypothetical protein
MLFDLINMSDGYTFLASDLECAAIVTVLLGSGQYGAREIGGEANVPIFLFGGADDWFRTNFNRTIEESVALHKGDRLPALIEALESVLIGDRAEYELTLPLIQVEKRDEWTAARHDRLRSSMNDIGARAKRTAAALKKGTRPEPAPQQVFAT